MNRNDSVTSQASLSPIDSSPSDPMRTPRPILKRSNLLHPDALQSHSTISTPTSSLSEVARQDLSESELADMCSTMVLDSNYFSSVFQPANCQCSSILQSPGGSSLPSKSLSPSPLSPPLDERSITTNYRRSETCGGLPKEGVATSDDYSQSESSMAISRECYDSELSKVNVTSTADSSHPAPWYASHYYKPCKFCVANGSNLNLANNHSLRDPLTKYVLCPVLSKHVCEVCGKTGIFAHTRSYCPETKNRTPNIAALMHTKRNSTGLRGIPAHLQRYGKQ